MSGLSREALILQEQLTHKFVATLAEKRASFETSWNQIRGNQWSPESQAKLRKLAHRLAGSAGSYGFDELGALAHVLDVALENAVSSQEQRLLIEKQTKSLIKALIEMEIKAGK